MARLLHLETATEVCSVCLTQDGKVIAIRETSEDKSHATRLAIFVQDCLQEAGFTTDDLDAVVVSKGPGSYTGLRIGVSLAKGICYGAGKPLIGISTLKAMADLAMQQYREDFPEEESILLCPMIDARRMEVYSAIYTPDLEEIRAIEAVVVDESSFLPFLENNKILFFGNGAAKCTAVLNHPNAWFVPGFEISSLGLIRQAELAFSQGIFEDSAYFEPFYLKDFIATIPKNKMF